MRISKPYTFGIIGCGHMGHAIAKGAIKEYLERREICVYDPSEKIQKICRREEFKVLGSALEVANESHIVLLAVTPQKLDEVLEEIKDAKIHTLLSIVTGVSIEYLQSKLNNCPVIRGMPNTPLQIRNGATALCMSSNCRADEYDFVFQLFNSMGVTRTIPEDKMNEVVAVHGSTPAYIYYFTQCIINDAVARGLDEEAARALAVQTVVGAGELMRRNPQTPLDDFLNEVCSEGGTTIEAIKEFKSQDLQKMVKEANDKCIDRAREIGK